MALRRLRRGPFVTKDEPTLVNEKEIDDSGPGAYRMRDRASRCDLQTQIEASKAPSRPSGS
jgi:hypothetical protein